MASYIKAEAAEEKSKMANPFEGDENDDDDDDDAVIFVPPPNTIDELTSQTLEMIAKEYSESAASKPTISEITQFALYKCLVQKCVYATNSMDEFRKHMEMHVQVIDYFQRKKLLDSKTRQELIKFRECVHCGHKSISNDQLLEHTEYEHRRCIFKCPHCVYRSIEVDNVLLHRKTDHPISCEDKAILLCDLPRKLDRDDKDVLKNAERNVKKIRCGQDNCTKEFACYNHLHAHLNREHTGNYECPYCEQTVAVNEHAIFEHLSSAHPGFDEFQCLVCMAGFNTIQAIRTHMALEHPSAYLCVGARRSPQPFDDESGGKLQLVYVGESQSTYKLANCSKPFALIAMDPLELVPSRQLEALKLLNIGNLKTKFTARIPKMSSTKSIRDIMTYETYEKLAHAEIDISHYKFASGCCANEEQTQLDLIVQHLMKCERRFICQQCPSRSFSRMYPYVSHCKEHDPNMNHTEIVERLQSTKTCWPLFNNMQIIMPDGRVSTMTEIDDTTIGTKIRGQIGEMLQNFWQQEKNDFEQFSTALAKLITPLQSNLRKSSDAVCAVPARVGGAIAKKLIVRRKSIAITNSIRNSTMGYERTSFVLAEIVDSHCYTSSLPNDSPSPGSNLSEKRQKSNGHTLSSTQLQGYSGQNGNNRSADVELNGNSRTVHNNDMDGTQTNDDEAHRESSLHGPQNTQLESTASNVHATSSIVQTTSTTRQEITTSVPSGSNTVMSNRNQRKRKIPQSSNLLAVENRAPRTIKPVDEYDKFRNHLVKALEEGHNTNCHHKIRTKLSKRLLDYIEHHPIVEPDGTPAPKKRAAESMEPLNTIETFFDYIMPTLRRCTKPKSSETTRFLLELNTLVEDILLQANSD